MPQEPTDTAPARKPDLHVDETLLKAYEGKIPRHVAIIMDGNGRWAKRRGMARIRGHHEGANTVRSVVESCRYMGVEVLTLYAFSSENWGRPEDEVSGLMSLFSIYIKKERRRLLDNEIRLRVIGNRAKLPNRLQKSIANLEEVSSVNDKMTLQVAVSYGGREEILRATKAIAARVAAGQLQPDDITLDDIQAGLYTAGQPDPDLLIRTSGEMRVSNFLLWQLAYTELYVTDVLWPDFSEADLVAAFADYTGRQRRFGKTEAQISGK